MKFAEWQVWDRAGMAGLLIAKLWSSSVGLSCSGIFRMQNTHCLQIGVCKLESMLRRGRGSFEHWVWGLLLVWFCVFFFVWLVFFSVSPCKFWSIQNVFVLILSLPQFISAYFPSAAFPPVAAWILSLNCLLLLFPPLTLVNALILPKNESKGE